MHEICDSDLWLVTWTFESFCAFPNPFGVLAWYWDCVYYVKIWNEMRHMVVAPTNMVLALLCRSISKKQWIWQAKHSQFPICGLASGGWTTRNTICPTCLEASTLSRMHASSMEATSLQFWPLTTLLLSERYQDLVKILLFLCYFSAEYLHCKTIHHCKFLILFCSGKNQFNGAYLTLGLKKKSANTFTCNSNGCEGDWHTLDRQGNTLPLIDYQEVTGAIDSYQYFQGGGCAHTIFSYASGVLVIRTTPCSPNTWSYPLCQRVP